MTSTAITSLLKKHIGVNRIHIINANIETVDSEEAIVIDVANYKKYQCCCPICGKKAPKYDLGRNKGLWRALDMGSTKVYLRADTHRVECPDHGVHTQNVSWARPGSRFTYNFEEIVAWLSLNLPRTAVAEYMRISWNTVGPILTRIEKELSAKSKNRFDNLVRIGIDETSFKKGHKYITVVVNHDTGNVIWVGEGHSENTLSKFFELLTDEQLKSIKLVSADGARWIASTMRKYCPNAERCIDPFHVVSWAQDILDKLKNKAVAEARKDMLASKPKRSKGRPSAGEQTETEEEKAYKSIKGSKYALLKNPENLTDNQKARLEIILLNNPKLARAYRLKEELRLIFKLPLEEVPEAIYKWRHKAWTSRIPEFVDFHKKILRHEEAILATMKYGLSNARIEAINNKIKLSIRMAYGFRNIENLFSTIMLRCGGLVVKLPGR